MRTIADVGLVVSFIIVVGWPFVDLWNKLIPFWLALSSLVFWYMTRNYYSHKIVKEKKE